MLNLPYNGTNDFGDWLARGIDNYKANYDLAFGYAVEVELRLDKVVVSSPRMHVRLTGIEATE